ncbi:MAG: autotransporter domain-containing protein [Chlamydiota bacterium]
MRKLAYKTVIFALSLSPALFSVDWTATGSGQWSETANWGNVPPPNSVGALAVFGSNITTDPTVITLGASATFTVGTLEINNNNIVNIGSNPTSNVQLQVNGEDAQLQLMGTGAHTILSNLILNSTVDISQQATSGVTINGVISGIGGVNKAGSEMLTLAGNNTFSGDFMVNEGTVELTGMNTLLGMMTIASTATVSGTSQAIAGGITVSGMLTVTAPADLAATTPLSVAATGGVSFAAAAATKNIGSLSGVDGGAININDNTLAITQTIDGAFDGEISGSGSLIKMGFATLTLAEGQGFSGETTISTGTLVISALDSLGIGPGALVLNGGILKLADSAPSITYSRGVTLSASSTIDTNGGMLTIDSMAITGAAGNTLIKVGTGTLNLADANAYFGDTVLSGGTISVGHNSSLGTGTVILEGGSLSAAAAGLDLANPITLNGIGTIDTNGNTLMLSGAIDGSGVFIKAGMGTLDVAGAGMNVYTGITRVNQGILQLSKMSSLGSSTELILNTSTTLILNATPVNFGGEVILLGDSTIDTNGNMFNINGGGISGSGSTLTKNGLGTLTTGARSDLGSLIVNAGVVNLAGSNTAGDVTIVAGTLNFTAANGVQSIGSLSGGGTLDFGTNELRIDQSSIGVFSGMLFGTGRLTKDGSAALTLSDAAGFTGDLVVNDGTLNFITTPVNIGNLSGAGGTVDFSTAGGITIEQTAVRTFAGNLSGSDMITKNGNGSLTLTGTNTFSGDFSVSAGTLEVNGSLAGATSIEVDGTITGSGTLGFTTVNGPGLVTGTGRYSGLTVNGTAQPDSLGTITVQNANYIQSGTFNIDIITLQNSGFVVNNGTADLTGSTLNVAVSGSCFTGQSYAVVATTGGIVGGTLPTNVNIPSDCQFAQSISPDGLTFLLTSLNTVLFIGQQVDPGNPTAVEDYLKCLGVTSDRALVAVLVATSALSDAELNEALNQFHPGLFGAFELASLDTHTLMTEILAEQMSCRQKCPRKTESPSKKVRQRGWVAPFGDFTNIDRYQQLRGYEAKSGGLLLGYDVCLPGCGVIGWSVGYHHTDLEWDQNAGRASINAGFGGLYLGCSSKYLALDAEVIGGANFYDVQRNIRFTGFSGQAKNNHNGYFFAPRVGLAIDTYPGRERIIRFFGAVNYDYLFQTSYTEGGAPGLDLQVAKKVSRALRTEAGIRFVADIKLETGCLYLFGAPSWVRKIPLDSGRYRSKLKDFINSPCLLVVDTFSSHKDLVGFDLGFFYTFDGNVASLVYRGEFGHDYLVNQIEGKWQWFF